MTREFGSTAWGRAWLSRIEPVTGMPDRNLIRARSIARRGVSDLTIEHNQVTGTIIDRGRTLTIALAVPSWTPDEQAVATRMLGVRRDTVHGDLPDELAEQLTAHGIEIAPEISALTVTPDREPSRAHVLALLYALVQRIDEEPTLALALRSSTDLTQPTPGSGAGHDRIPIHEIDPEHFYDASSRPPEGR